MLEAAGDVADIARLLGYEKIALFGGSFGSHWSMAVLREHPDLVERALLHGMEGPDHTYDMPSGVLAALERMAKAAEASEQLRDRVPEEGLIEAFKGVLESVREDPFDIDVRHPRTGEDVPVRIDHLSLRDLALGTTTRVSSRNGMPRWPLDLLRLIEGDFEPAARALLADRGESDLPTASFFMLDCGSGISPERAKVLNADPAIEVVGDLGWFYRTACPSWDADLGDAFRAGFRTDVPTLIVHGTWDVNTPLENALECIPMFSDHRFVPVEGGSHGALWEAMRHDHGFRDAVMAFLATGAQDELPDQVVLPPLEWQRP